MGIAVCLFGKMLDRPVNIAAKIVEPRLVVDIAPQSRAVLVSHPPKSAIEVKNPTSKRPILASDIPQVRRDVEDAIVRGVAAAMQTRGKDYEVFFRSQGLDEAAISRLLEYISAIYEARLELQASTGQLATVRREYDKVVRQLLGDRINAYQEKEKFSAANAEYDALVKFARAHGSDINPTDQQKIVALVYASDAYANPTAEFGGVYADWPAAASGAEAPAMLEYSAKKLELQLKEILSHAEEASLGPESIKILSDYYSVGVARYASMLQRSNVSAGKAVSDRRQIIQQQEADQARKARLNQIKK